MPEEGTLANGFLDEAGWVNAKQTPIAGDMSARRFHRLELNGSTAILMEANAPMHAFVRMTGWLIQQGLSVPSIIAGMPDVGLLLLEDFGDTSLKDVLQESPEFSNEIFEDCITLLLRIRKASPPSLHQPGALELVEWTALVEAHYPGVQTGGLMALRNILTSVLGDVLMDNASVSLRDFHTENMMWLPHRAGHLRLGLLDYQDAFMTHPVYDLMSLLTDARTWVPRSIRNQVMARYLDRSGDDAERFSLAFAALSVQRNLRILGVFARAGKHVSAMPNTYRYLIEALEHPAFIDLRETTLHALPPPAVSV